MSGRYTSWYHKHGALDAPGWLVDEGKRLLGYLEDRRKLSGIKTIAASKEFSDGSKIRAAFWGDIPIVEYTVGGVTSVQAGSFLEGFVFRPTDESIPTFSQDTHDETILDPTKAWLAWVFDAAHIDPLHHNHVTPPGVQIYVPTFPGFHVLSPTDVGGIGYYGNVDWRNSDESLAVSWYGPRSRYFFENDLTGMAANVTGIPTKQPWVFCKGRLLFSIADYESALLGVTGCYITGACLKADADTGALSLIVIATHLASPGNYNDYVVTASVRAGPISSVFTIDPATVALRKTYNWGVLASGDGIREGETMHPWFFNSTGKQARTIRSYYQIPSSRINYVRELVMDLSNLASITFTPIDTPIPDTTTTVHTSGTRTLYLKKVSDSVMTFHAGTPYTVTVDGVQSVIGTIPVQATPGSGDISRVSFPYVDKDITRVTTQSRARYKIAVDFRNDIPVYAYNPAFSSTQTEHNVTSAWSATYTGTLSPTLTDTGGGTYRLDLSGTSSHSETLTRDYTSTQTSNPMGIETDFVTVGSPLTNTITFNATFDCSVSGSFAGNDTSFDPSIPGPSDGLATGVCRTEFGPIGSGSYGIATMTSGSATASCDATGTMATTSIGDQQLILLHLDLRFESISYLIVTTNDSRAMSFSHSYTPSVTYNFGASTCSPEGYKAASYSGYTGTYDPLTISMTDTPDRNFKEHVVMAAVETETETVAAPPLTASNYPRGFWGGPVFGRGTTFPVGDSIASGSNGVADCNFAGSVLAGMDYFLGYGDVHAPNGDDVFYVVMVGDPAPSFSSITQVQQDWTISDPIPSDLTVDETITTTGQGDLTIPFVPMASRISLDSNDLHCYPDNSHFLHYGSWENHKGAWAYSQIKPIPNLYASGRTSKISSGDIRARIGAQAYHSMFYPIWMLPRTEVRK